MEVVVASNRRGPAGAVGQGVLVGLLTVSCALSARAEVFLAAIGVLSLGIVLASSRTALVRACRSMDRRVLVWAILLAVLWLYGVARGMSLGHPVRHVLRNFFGLAFFLPSALTAILFVGPSGIARIVARVGVLALVLLVALRMASIFGVVRPEALHVLGVPVGVSDYGFRLYSFGVFPIFGWEAMTADALYRELRQRANRDAGFRALQLLLIITCTAFVTESKGTLLGLIVVLGVPLLLRRHWRDHARYAVAVGCLLAVHLEVVPPSASYAATNWLGLKPSELLATVEEEARASAEEEGAALPDVSRSVLLDSIFGARRLGNVARYVQTRELLNDIVPLGRGLGAPISSGYRRSRAFPYGFELSFLNVVHKLGVFSLVYFAFLVYSVYRMVTSTKPLQERCVALGLLGYLLPAIGNPILFAVEAVFLHMFALHAVTRRSVA